MRRSSIAEPLQDWSTVVRAFNTMAQVRVRNGRIEESMAFRERALKLALAHDLTEHALRTYNNLASSTDRCSSIASRRRETSPSPDWRWHRRAETAAGNRSFA